MLGCFIVDGRTADNNVYDVIHRRAYALASYPLQNALICRSLPVIHGRSPVSVLISVAGVWDCVLSVLLFLVSSV